MTVPQQPTRTTHVGNGVTTVFAYDFLCLAKRDLQVIVSGAVIDPSAYTVSNIGLGSGGDVTFNLAPASQAQIIIQLNMVLDRETDYQTNGDLFAKTVNFDFDRLWLAIQQAFGYLVRVPRLGDSDVDGAGAYLAKGNRITNLGDPVGDTDAVNQRSMFSFVTEYVDKAIAGVVGGFGWFLQTGIGAVFRTFQDKMRDTVSAADFGALGDGSNETALFANMDATPGRRINLLGRTYLVDAIPNGNDYFNGAFKVGTDIFWRHQNPRLHPFDNPAATVRAVLPTEGVYRGLNVGILPLPGSSLWKMVWRESTGHGVENGTAIMAADTADAGKTLTNTRIIYRTATADTRNFVSGVMGAGRVGIIAARPQEAGTYLDPVFIYSDNPGATNESWSAITMPTTSNVDFHGAIYPWPASAGGHDTLGYIAYGYRPTAQGGGISAWCTVDNGNTWTELTNIIPVTGAFPNLSEIAVSRIGKLNRWVATIRTSASLNMAVAISSDMRNWSTAADSGLKMGGNPPSVFYEDGKLWMLTFSRTGQVIIPEYGNAIVISEGNAEEIWASSGTTGWKGWKILTGSNFWPTGYISLQSVRGRWYGLFTMAEEQAGNSRGRTAYLGMLSSDALESASARQMKATIPQRNTIYNGGLQLWQAGTSFTTFATRMMVADGFTFARAGFAAGATVSRVNGTKGRYALRVRRDDGDSSTAMMNLSVVLTMDESIPYRDKVVAIQLRVTGGAGFSAANGFLGVQLRQTNNASEQFVTSSSGLFSVGDSPVDSSGTGVNIDGLSRDFVLVVQNVAKDTTQLLLRINWTPVGTAANDYFDLEMLKMEPGRLATPFVWESEDEVYDRAQRFYQTKNVRAENGSRHIPLAKMHRVPAVTVSVGTAANETRDGFELTHTAAADCAVVATAVM